MADQDRAIGQRDGTMTAGPAVGAGLAAGLVPAIATAAVAS
jgi:hypothetical protein